jgi:hypothetical protein
VFAPRVLPVISAFMSRGVPEGEPVVLDVAQLEALLSRTFGIGLDAGRGKEPVALVRLRLARALLGAAEANAVATHGRHGESAVTGAAALRDRHRTADSACLGGRNCWVQAYAQNDQSAR